jgi:hypothetical protein
MNELPNLPGYLFEPSLAGVLSTLLTFILPLVAALVMRQSWGTGAKGTTLLALAAVKVFLEAVIAFMNAGISFNPLVIFYGVALNFLVAVAIHFGLLRGTNIQQAAMRVGDPNAVSA